MLKMWSSKTFDESDGDNDEVRKDVVDLDEADGGEEIKMTGQPLLCIQMPG